MRKATHCDSNARNGGTRHALLAAVSLLGVSLLSVSFDVTAQAASNSFMTIQQSTNNLKQEKLKEETTGNQTTGAGADKSTNNLKQEKLKEEKVKEEKLKEEHEAHHKKGEKGLKGETTNTPTPVGYDLLQQKEF